ncbi:hypothetical protein EUX98_g7704 [Antrodiella citrinella]|uniref:Uncharacterized protein n=1 Tax=Antrodiella citrinella TaxID=2447956 RepID=A0A4S4MKV4_9APHY|nr:hypothetical protein EUX98_g7704 [Antrodiella citrinella]
MTGTYRNEVLGQSPDEDADSESDSTRVAFNYLNKPPEPGRSYDDATVRKNCNLLGRTIHFETLKITSFLDIFTRGSVSDERLSAFLEDPDTHGPKLHSSYLHLPHPTTGSALTPTEAMKSDWNQALQYNMAKSAEYIVEKCPSGEFGDAEFDFQAMFKDRMFYIFRTICKAYPQEGESLEEAGARVLVEYFKDKASKKERTHRAAKHRVRSEVAGLMVGICRTRGDKSGEKFWAYVLRSLGFLGENGMSDEEDQHRVITLPNGRRSLTPRPVKVVLELKWRHPSFVQLFKRVDETRTIEDHIFRRDPPPGLPRSFFVIGYFDNMPDYKVARLKLSEEDVVLYNFSYNGRTYI